VSAGTLAVCRPAPTAQSLSAVAADQDTTARWLARIARVRTLAARAA
jgi:hypothetical protein